MMLSRSLALVAAGVLSVAACHVYVRDPYATYQPPPPRPRPAVVVRPAPPAPAPEPSPPQPSRATVRYTPAPPSATVTATSPESTPSALSTPVSTPASTPPAACLDTGPAPVGDCSAIKPPDASCGRSSSASQKCNAYKTYFDAKIAALAVTCVTALSSKQVCDPSQPLICAKTALAQACADPSVVQLCQIAATSCKITPGECSALLSGLNETGQETLAQCVAQGCPAGLGGCIDGLAKK